MSDEQRAEALARLMSKTCKLDDREVEELHQLWGEVCDTHVKAVFGKLAKRVPPADAEELGQDVLADGFFAFCEAGAPDNLRNLLLTIADRRLSHFARYKARHPASAEMPTSSTEKPMSSSALADRILARREQAEKIMARLSPEQEEAFRLIVVEKMPYADAAATLGIPVGTLSTRVRAAKSAIHRAAEELDPPSEGGTR
jgi:RNA polymerase sigma-70 factor, ECF subfamily